MVISELLKSIGDLPSRHLVLIVLLFAALYCCLEIHDVYLLFSLIYSFCRQLK